MLKQKIQICLPVLFPYVLLSNTNLPLRAIRQIRYDAQCCQVKENQEEINHEEHEEKERNFIPHLRALRGEKFLIVQHCNAKKHFHYNRYRL